MEEIKLRYQQLLQATVTLQSMIKQLQLDDGKIFVNSIAYRDSVIKRFEYTYDLFWKYLKHYFRIKFGLELQNPRAIYKECFNQLIIDKSEEELLLQMVFDRNLSVHSYDEDLIDEMIPRIFEYEELINRIMQKIQ